MTNSQKEIKEYTIVTTVYNDEKEAIMLLKELENQVYYPDEVIIVDGGSQDRTVECIKEFCEQSYLNIRLIYGDRLNIAQGLNRGICDAHNDLIGIAMCGNHYKSDFFQKLYDDIKNDENIYVTYGALRGVSTCNRGKKFIQFIFGGEDKCYLEKFPTNHGNLSRKQLFDACGYFYEKFQYAGEDREFFLRVKKQGYKIYGDNDAVIEWEIPENAKQYCKQQIGYTISDLEMYNNKAVCKIYWKRGCYVLAWVFLLLCILNLKTRLFGLGIGLWLMYKNVCKFLQYGLIGCILLNLANFVPVFTIIRNSRFLMNKNKIPNPLDNYYM